MAKLILKTAAVTLAAIVSVALIVFGIVSLAFPSAMVTFTDKLGMESAAAYYSVSVYDKSGEIGDLAEAVERSYNAKHYRDAAEYGNLLLGNEDFLTYSASRDASDSDSGLSDITGGYAQYARGIVCSAEYFTGKKEAALKTAFGGLNGNFPKNNAVVYLTATAQSEDDREFCEEIAEELAKISPEAEEDAERLTDFLAGLKEYCKI